METMLYQVNPRELSTKAPYMDLFPLDKVRVETLSESMKVDGFLKVYPIAVWNGVVVDGHTRLAAAKKSGIREVECAYIDFKNEDDALAFAIRAQRNRRNLTEADLVRCLEALDHRKSKAEAGSMRGNPGEQQAQHCASSDQDQPKIKSSRVTADIMGISPRQVEKIRTVLDHAPEELKEALSKNEKTVNAAYLETQAIRKAKDAPAPEAMIAISPDPATVIDFEFGIVKTVRASSVESAREQFLIWCRTASEKQIMAVAVCEKAKVSA